MNSIFYAEACIESKMIMLLSGYFSAVQGKVHVNSRLVEDLRADSVDVVEIVVMVEEEFSVELSSVQVAAWRSVADVVSSVLEALE